MSKIGIRRFLTVLVSLVLACSIAMAQSAADKLYNQGLQLQKTLTVQSQRAAIAKFQGAKKLYDSAQKKAMCDNAIAVSKSIMSKPASPVVPRLKRDNPRKEETVEVKEKTLSVSNSEFNLSNAGIQFAVTVTASDPDWEVSTDMPRIGKSFVSAKRTGDNIITIDVGRNSSYKVRSQSILVKLGNIERTIVVNQKGQIANLDADPLKLEFKAGGQIKEMVVYCDSDEEYEYNHGRNWFIVSQPEWINVVIDSSKDGFGDFLKKAFSKKKRYAENMLPTKLQVQCLELTKGAGTAYRDGRTDYLVLGSGEAEVKVLIIQKPGK